MIDDDLLGFLRRWWWALLLGTAVAALAGYVAASHATKTYEAQVRLLVGPINSSVDLEASGGLARTYADLATSEPILRHALRGAGERRSLETFKDDVATSSNTITRIVTLTVRDHDPRLAAKLADRIADRLRTLANSKPPRASTALDQLLRQPELAPLSGERRDAVMEAAARVFGASEAGRIEVVQAASVPQRPAAPSIPLMTLLAALVGFCVAALVALALDVRRAGRAAALEPEDGSATARFADAGSSVEAPEPESGAAYRMLAARARLLDEGRGARSLMVLDSAGGSAAATVAARLASVAAEEGRSVVVVDLGTAGSGISDQLGVAGEHGYADVVADGTAANGSLEAALVRRGERLFVLPRGSAVPGQVQSMAQLASVVKRLGEHAEVVIVAGPPLTRSSSVIAGVAAVDQVCLVVDSQADGDELQRVVVALERLDGRFVGAVLRGRRPPRRTRDVLRAR